MRRILALVVCLPVFAMSTIVLAQDGDRRMMDHGRGGGMGGMGVGTGIGIGIGIGEAISRQPAAEPAQSSQPEVRRVVKKKVKPEKKEVSKSDKPTAPKSDTPAVSKSDTALKFDGKPWYVTHNAAQTEGKIGRQTGHQSVLIEKDGHYSKRSYYAGSDGDGPKWYWYDKPLEDSDPVIPLLPYVVTCPERSDDCRLTEKKSSDPERVKNHDVVLAGFWEVIYGIEGDCSLNSATEPGTIPKTVLMNCTTVGLTSGCNGVCRLYDLNGKNYPIPTRTNAGNQVAYECLCKAP